MKKKVTIVVAAIILLVLVILRGYQQPYNYNVIDKVKLKSHTDIEGKTKSLIRLRDVKKYIPEETNNTYDIVEESNIRYISFETLKTLIENHNKNVSTFTTNKDCIIYEKVNKEDAKFIKILKQPIGMIPIGAIIGYFMAQILDLKKKEYKGLKILVVILMAMVLNLVAFITSATVYKISVEDNARVFENFKTSQID